MRAEDESFPGASDRETAMSRSVHSGSAFLLITWVVLALGAGPQAQPLSSSSYQTDCTFILPAAGVTTSPGYESLTALGGNASAETTSTGYRTTLYVLCTGSGCQVIVCGDCNGDGTLSILDALIAAQHGVGALILVGQAFDSCNVDGDMDVDVLDALLLAQGASGLPVSLVCC